jgi:hypothetical protein
MGRRGRELMKHFHSIDRGERLGQHTEPIKEPLVPACGEDVLNRPKRPSSGGGQKRLPRKEPLRELTYDREVRMHVAQ